MTESVLFARHLVLSTVAVAVHQSIDGQGKPTFATAVNIRARALRKRRVVVQADGTGLSPGTKLVVDLTLWIPAGQPVFPDYQDRATYDAIVYLVIDVADVNGSDGNLVFRRVHCQRERGPS